CAVRFGTTALGNLADIRSRNHCSHFPADHLAALHEFDVALRVGRLTDCRLWLVIRQAYLVGTRRQWLAVSQHLFGQIYGGERRPGRRGALSMDTDRADRP